jgi:hypothetical protein
MLFQIKQYDDKSAMKTILESNGEPVDLDLVSEVRFLMKSGRKLLIDKPVFYVQDELGTVWFPFEVSETSKAGKFQGEFVLYFKDARRETFPNVGTITISIEASNIALKMTEGV